MAHNGRVLPVAGAMFIDVWDPERPAEWFTLFAPAGATVFTVASGTIEAVEHDAGRVLLKSTDSHSIWYAALDETSIETARGARVNAGIPIGRIRAPSSGHPRLGLLVADASGTPISPYRFLIGARDPLEVFAHRDPAVLDGLAVDAS